MNVLHKHLISNPKTMLPGMPIKFPWADYRKHEDSPCLKIMSWVNVHLLF